MAGRKDAVAAAAEMINYVEQRCTLPNPDPTAEDTMLVCTVGELR
jgi:hypothetical protein